MQNNQEAVLTDLAETHNTNSIDVAQKVAAYENALAALRAEHLEKIRAAAQEAAVSEAALHNAVTAAPAEIWEKRKSRQVGVVSFGWRKKKGSIVIVDMDDSIDRLRAAVVAGTVSGEGVEAMIKTTETLDKNMLKNLPIDIAKKAGIQITADTDEVFVKDGMTGEGAKFVKNLKNDAFEVKGL